MTKKLLILIVCIMTAVCGFAQATSGECGENLSWDFDSSTGTLTIGGTGNMTNYKTSGDIPWNDFKYKITNLIIGAGITSISNYAFFDCYKIPSVIIPSGVTTIGNDAFFGCDGFITVTIPASVTEIGAHAFVNCRHLEVINVAWSRPIAITEDVFINTPIVNVILKVPAGTEIFYRNAEYWKEFNIVEAAGIKDVQVSSINIYPNPVLESFRINNGISESTFVTILDISGKTVLQQTVTPNEPVAVEHLQSGIYFVNVKGKTVKLIKQ